MLMVALNADSCTSDTGPKNENLNSFLNWKLVEIAKKLTLIFLT